MPVGSIGGRAVTQRTVPCRAPRSSRAMSRLARCLNTGTTLGRHHDTISVTDPACHSGDPGLFDTDRLSRGRGFQPQGGRDLRAKVRHRPDDGCLHPQEANAKGIGVVFVVSGGFFSSHEAINPSFIRPFIDRGFTVFAVVHGSQPRFTVPEIIQDMNRAVRFIRHHAKDYGIDPDRIGVYGGSAGGHLSLMLGMAGDKGDPNAKDPVDRESSRVQAVACFFPPTDLLNFGKPGKEMIHATDHQPPFRAAFDYRELDKPSMLWLPITDDQRLREITRQISPITFVTPDDPPTLIIHGDEDTLVPLQQSEVIVDKFKKTGVEAKLVVKKGAGHGWLGSGQRPDPVRRLVRPASQEEEARLLLRPQTDSPDRWRLVADRWQSRPRGIDG